MELFMCPHSYIDTATMGHFVNTTGGQLHYYPHFKVTIMCDIYTIILLYCGSKSKPTVCSWMVLTAQLKSICCVELSMWYIYIFICRYITLCTLPDCLSVVV